MYHLHMSHFDDFLERYELTGSELSWYPFKEALACFDEETVPPEGIIYQPLFTILRGGMSSGDERNFVGIFGDAGSDSAVLYFADDAGGFGRLWRVSKADGPAIQALILGQLDVWGWGPLQLYDTEISNYAPRLVPRKFFVRMVQEAFDRHPDLIDAWDEVYESPEHLVKEIYLQW
jgi:hypothetical protein